MKIRHFGQKLFSTLSCITKCLGFSLKMIYKKMFFGIFLLSFLGACAAPTAMLGPAYTFSSSGSLVQAGLSYGSSELIKSYTGQSPMENLIELSEIKIDENKKKNIKKRTVESEEFQRLVEKRIKMTNGILNSNQ